MMSDLAVGQIIQLSDKRKAVIRFVGQTHFSQGDWVGVELDDDSGKNDGAVQGERYFDCAMGRGMLRSCKQRRRKLRRQHARLLAQATLVARVGQADRPR
jgi:dynactin complex subunit